MTAFLILMGLLAADGAVAAIREVALDGYRRRPVEPGTSAR